MIMNYEILIDNDLKNLETKVKRKINTWHPSSSLSVIPNPKKYNEFALQIVEFDQIDMIPNFLDYEIIIRQDLNSIQTYVQKALPNNWIPIFNLLVIPNHQGYNEFAIQLVEIDPNNSDFWI